MRRALFILYYFPPAGGIGVQRGLKFIRYLPEFGWRATVLTVRAGAAFPVRDETLLDEIPPDVLVRRTPCPELYGLYRRLGRHAATTDVDTASQSAGEFKPHRRILRALRGALFIPDGRMLWAPHAIRAGRQLLDSAKHEAVFSSGPPFTSHLIARALHRSHGLPWIADYRDPWTQATFYPRRPPIARAIDLRLEASCIREATCTVIVGAGMEAEFRRRYPDLPPQRLRVIPNGYDEADFAAVPYRHPQHLRITHSGSLFYRR
ncbi:MAG: glycosyltransferase, partial [Candidatus Eisenbacteria bacterium]